MFLCHMWDKTMTVDMKEQLFRLQERKRDRHTDRKRERGKERSEHGIKVNKLPPTQSILTHHRDSDCRRYTVTVPLRQDTPFLWARDLPILSMGLSVSCHLLSYMNWTHPSRSPAFGPWVHDTCSEKFRHSLCYFFLNESYTLQTLSTEILGIWKSFLNQKGPVMSSDENVGLESRYCWMLTFISSWVTECCQVPN